MLFSDEENVAGCRLSLQLKRIARREGYAYAEATYGPVNTVDNTRNKKKRAGATRPFPVSLHQA